MSLLSRIFGSHTETKPALLCPHCEEPMGEGHDVERCARKRMSRRFFFGILGGAAAAVAIAPAFGSAELGEWTVEIETGPALITLSEFRNEALFMLQRNLVLANDLDRMIALTGTKIGDTINVRKPLRFMGRG